MKLEKLDGLTLKELVELKNCVNEIVLRTHITGSPTTRWNEYNLFLSTINKKIEDLIYNEYIA